jgi:hypothetical protein
VKLTKSFLSFCLALSFVATSSSAAMAAGEPIMPLSDVTPGMSCTAKTVFSGTTATEFPVTVRDIYSDPSTGDFLLVEVGGAAASTGIASGMSGSPVYCPVAGGGTAIAGALSYGIGWENDQVGLATPIERMIDGEVSVNSASKPAPAAVAAAARRMAKLPIPMQVSGLNESSVNLLNKRSDKFNFIAASGSDAQASDVAALEPGSSVGVGFTAGDIIAGGIGTVSYRDGSKIWAFGHPMDDVGPSSLFMTEAPITTIVDAAPSAMWASYKLGSFGANVGTLNGDNANAVTGLLGAGPAAVSTNRAHVTGLVDSTVNVSVADEESLGFPHGNWIEMIAGFPAMQATYESVKSAYVPRLSTSLCWTFTVRQLKDPFRFCKKMVGQATFNPMFGGSQTFAWIAEQEYFAARMIYSMRSANLSISDIAVAGKASNDLQVASLKSAKQIGRSYKGKAKIRLSYLTPAGTTKTSDIKIPFPEGSGKKKITVSGSQKAIKQGVVLDNSKQIANPTPSPYEPSVEEPLADPKNLQELQDMFSDLNGRTQLKVYGLKGGVRHIANNLNGLLPVGGVSVTVK